MDYIIHREDLAQAAVSFVDDFVALLFVFIFDLFHDVLNHTLEPCKHFLIHTAWLPGDLQHESWEVRLDQALNVTVAVELSWLLGEDLAFDFRSEATTNTS
jgi:hypothetical protein